MVGDTLSASVFFVLGGALVIEALDRFRVSPIDVDDHRGHRVRPTCTASDQEQLLPALVLVVGMGLAAVIVVLLYRRRGYLAA